MACHTAVVDEQLLIAIRNREAAGADLRKADLRGADLREVNLEGTDLRKADLRGQTFAR